MCVLFSLCKCAVGILSTVCVASLINYCCNMPSDTLTNHILSSSMVYYRDHTCYFMHGSRKLEPEAARPRVQTASERHG